MNATTREIKRRMTLRDYFAAKALPVIIEDAERFNEEKARPVGTSCISKSDVAVACYLYADAMMAERAGK
jgi:hypothetical protein